MAAIAVLAAILVPAAADAAPAPAPPPTKKAITQVSWSVLLCQFSDNTSHNVPGSPINDARDIADFLINRGTGGAADYWHAVSGGQVSFAGSVVRGWFTMRSTLANDPNISRDQRIQDCVDAAALGGYVVPAGHRVIAFRNQCGDGGADGARRVLLDACAGDISFAAHEMGHGMGLEHSFSDDQSYGDPSNPGEYDDEWDVMSAMHVISTPVPRWTARPVGLNAYHLSRMGWIPAAQVTNWTAKATGSVTLAPLYSTSASGTRLLRVQLDPADASHYYTVEYRFPQGLDAPIGTAVVQIHEVRGDRSYLLRKDNGRRPTQQLVLDGRTHIRVVSSGGPTATVEVSGVPAPPTIGGPFGSWNRTPAIAREVAIASVGGGGWEMFHVGTDHAIYRLAPWAGIGSWQRMPNTYAKKVAATMNLEGRVELVHIGSDDAIWHAWQDSPGGPFGSWQRIPAIASDVAITTVANGPWEMYHVGTDHAIYRLAPWAGIRSWQRMDNTYAKKVAATNLDGRVELVHIGSDDAIWHASQRWVGGGFNPWHRIPAIAREVAITSAGGGRWEMYHVGTDQAIYRMAPWSDIWGWQRMPNTVAKKLSATTNRYGRVELVHVGSDDAIWHAWQV